ncbi:hypothetical protein Trydic_g17192 [Trypoxylus dichotomus]
MDVGTYNIKIQEIINEGKYKELKKDPTASVESKIQQTLKKYKSDLPNQLSWQKLTPRCTKPPHLYGLPKIHKPGTPLRPIVTSRNSPCHPLPKFVLDIIAPLSGNTQSAITNTKHFINEIREITIDEHDKLVDNKFYQQEFGMAMGSPLSPALSNIYMEEYERREMDLFELKPKMWLRYVDDTFVIWPHGEEEINGFLRHLNGLEESIKFPME